MDAILRRHRTPEPTTETPHDAAHDDGAAVMTMLHDHVPLSLLCDLTTPDGPRSAEILAEEGGPEQPWWQQAQP
jgi:hypothetical protein